jgi:hypothetical protein
MTLVANKLFDTGSLFILQILRDIFPCIYVEYLQYFLMNGFVCWMELYVLCYLFAVPLMSQPGRSFLPNFYLEIKKDPFSETLVFLGQRL